MSECLHISQNDIEKYFGIDEFNISPNEIQFYHNFIKKITSCPDCRARYMLGIDSKIMLKSNEINIQKYLLSSVANVVENKLEKFESSIKSKLQLWLSGSRELLNSFDTIDFGNAHIAIATRGDDEHKNHKTFELSAQEYSCDFAIEEKTDVIFKISRITDDGEPICLIIEGRKDTEYEDVFTLTGLELLEMKSNSITSPVITLEKGDYVLYVPVLKKQ